MEKLLARIAEVERRINWLIEQIRALLRHLRRVEQALRELPDAPLNFAQNGGGQAIGVYPAMSGGGGAVDFNAGTGVPGPGTATLYTIAAGVWTATAQTVPYLNLSATAVSANVRLLLAFDGTNYWPIWEDC